MFNVAYSRIILTLCAILCLSLACSEQPEAESTVTSVATTTVVTEPSLVILGTIQDAGSPHIGCVRACCIDLYTNPDPSRMVVSLGLLDPANQKRYLFEATPDLPKQMELLHRYTDYGSLIDLDGIFLTHAHIGHYAGLMFLGREALGANQVPVYAMPRMKDYLQGNGPWSQLVALQNISINDLQNESIVELTDNIRVTPFLVPHRDEFSETVGYRIEGPNKTAIFIPDINKWEKWETPLVEAIASVDLAFIDGSFYDGEELGHRDMAEVPHPSISETLALLRGLNAQEKAKVQFIHFNHTNPLLNNTNAQYKEVIDAGFNIAHTFDVFTL